MGSVMQMVTYQIEVVTVNEPDTGRGTDLKMETLPRITCIQVQLTFHEFWQRITDPPLILLSDKAVDAFIMKVFCELFE